MGTLLKHGSAEQKAAYLPKIASGDLRLQAFGVTEPEAGTDTTSLRTTAIRRGDGYLINGRKMYISRVQHSDMMVLLARTTPRDEVKRKSDGLSVFLVDLHQAIGHGLTVNPRRVMINNLTNELVFEDLQIPAAGLVGEEGEGFGRPIGANQGIQFPLARAHVAVEAADLMRFRAAALFDAGEPCGAEANMALLLAADAAWDAANAAMQTFGGYSFDSEYDVERKFRETRLFQVAPISTNLILAYVGQHVLGLPRS